MTTLAELITEADGGGDATAVARRVLKTVLAGLEPADQEAALLPLVRQQVTRLRRRVARKKEDAAFRDRAAAADGELAALRLLRDEPFLDVITRKMITWAQATVKQHRARAKYLRESLVKPTTETAGRHEAAARIIEQRGAERLADLPEFAQPDQQAG